MLTDDERAVQLRRDNADRVAPWAGYGWKVNELLDRAQAAEAEVRRLRDGIRTRAGSWDRDAPRAPAFEVADDFRRLIGDNRE